MSADLSKSKLASKDKDELTQIAQAMGGKPGSRARKADIIDLIMELATGGPDQAPPASSSPSTPETPPAPTVAPAYSADPMADARDAAANEGSGRSTRRAAGGRGKSTSQPDPNRRNDASNDGPSNNDSDGNPKADSRGGESTEAAASGASNDADGDNDNEPTEPGNRRRRRRGRGRDRGEQIDEYTGEPVAVDGVLDLRDDGYGFLRVNGFLPTREDVYVSVKQVRQHGLRKGDRLIGAARPANRSEKNPAMLRVDAVNNQPADAVAETDRRHFEDLTAILPTEKLSLEREDDPDNGTARIIDLLAPIGKGQRGLIVGPLGSGATTILRDVARSIETNHPDVQLMVLLLDERPEEVTEMQQLILNGEVVASTFDQAADEHASVAELTLERAKRLVELGQDVVVIFDGITRLARANNIAAAGNGQVSSHGISASAIHPAKKFFGAARNTQDGGSLTILATAMSETGSAIDEFIFDEFAGTANMELRLDRHAAAQRIHPALDVMRSGTRNEAELFEDDELAQVAKLRRNIAAAGGESGSVLASLEFIVGRLDATDTNTEILKQAP